VYVTESLITDSKKFFRTALVSSYIKEDILLTPPLLANLLIAGFVIPSIVALGYFRAWRFAPIFPSPFPPFPLAIFPDFPAILY
jgi:hypothetical protein